MTESLNPDAQKLRGAQLTAADLSEAKRWQWTDYPTTRGLGLIIDNATSLVMTIPSVEFAGESHAALFLIERAPGGVVVDYNDMIIGMFPTMTSALNYAVKRVMAHDAKRPHLP